MSEKSGGLRSMWAKWVGSPEEAYDRENATRSTSLGGQPCCGVRPRHRATLVGPLRCVTIRPRNGVPALEAELHDGSGAVTLIWLGRRGIAGIETGRWVRVEGMVTEHNGQLLMFNPRYELAPGAINDLVQA